MLQNFGLLLSWVFIAAYLRELVIFSVLFVMLVVYVSLETIIFKCSSESKRNAARQCKVQNIQIEKEINSCFLTAIFTSWVSPCSVWFCTDQKQEPKFTYNQVSIL